MDGLKLNPGERVIQENSKVGYGGLLLNNSLVITDQSLILVKKSLMGHVKDIIRFPLDQIMVSDGEVQAIVGKDGNLNAILSVYFTTGQETFRFEWEEDAKKVKKCISEVITGQPVPDEKDEFFDDILGFANTIAGSVNKLKSAFGFKSTEQVSCHCPSCGASITGVKGETIKCPYCDSYYTF